MKHLSFGYSALAGFAIACLASATFYVLSYLLPAVVAMRLALSLATLAYIIFLMAGIEVRRGKFVFPIIILAVIAAPLLASISLMPYVATHLFAIWLTRAIYLYRPLQACLDTVGLLVSAAIAIWSLSETHSLFIALWTFFLIQAALLPTLTGTGMKRAGVKAQGQADEQFSRALRTAQGAFTRLNNSAPGGKS